MIGNIKDFGLYIRHAAAGGLNAVKWSLAYSIAVIGVHFHSYERWFVAAAVPVGETHVADGLNGGSTPFIADGGNDTWGAWVQVLGSSDTPVVAGCEYFDPHEMTILTTEHNGNTYFVQMAFGDSGAAGLAAGTYTETVIKSLPAAPGDASPQRLQTKRQAAGTKAWVRIWAVGKNTGTMSFHFGIHEYEG